MTWRRFVLGRGPLSEADAATRGSGIRLAAEAGTRALSIATTFLLVVALGVEAWGLFAAAGGMAILFAELAEMGLQPMASRALVARTASLGSLVRAKLALTGPVALAAVAGPRVVEAVAPGLVGPALQLATPLVLYYVLSGWSELLGIALRARGTPGQEAAVLLALRGATLAAVVTAVRMDAGLSALAWAHALSAVPPLAVALVLVGRRREAAAPQLPTAAVLREALPLAINSGLVLVALRVELLALYFVRGGTAVGLFTAALRLLESLNAVPAAVTAGAMPALTREGLRAARGGAVAGDVRRRLSGMVVLLAVPAAVGLCLGAPRILALFGEDYVAAAPALRLLTPALVALFVNVVLIHSLIAVGRADRLPALMGIRVVLAGVLAVALVPALGPRGGAIGFTVSETAFTLLAARACAGAGFTVPLLTPLARAALLSLPMATVVALADLGPVGSLLVGGFTYAATLAATWRLRPASFRFLGAGTGVTAHGEASGQR